MAKPKGHKICPACGATSWQFVECDQCRASLEDVSISYADPASKTDGQCHAGPDSPRPPPEDVAACGVTEYCSCSGAPAERDSTGELICTYCDKVVRQAVPPTATGKGSGPTLSVQLPNGKRVALAAQPLLIGRDETQVDTDAAIALADYAGVSRRHALVLTQGERLFIIDLGSSNGTTVGARRIKAFFLEEVTNLPARVGLGENCVVTIDRADAR